MQSVNLCVSVKKGRELKLRLRNFYSCFKKRAKKRKLCLQLGHSDLVSLIMYIHGQYSLLHNNHTNMEIAISQQGMYSNCILTSNRKPWMNNPEVVSDFTQRSWKSAPFSAEHQGASASCQVIRGERSLYKNNNKPFQGKDVMVNFHRHASVISQVCFFSNIWNQHFRNDNILLLLL